MTETAAQEAVTAAPVKTPKKKASSPKVKGAAKKASATHPPTAQMVNSAIKSLKERGGSSLQAIKKYIAGTYKVDAEKLSPFIKKYLKSAVDGGKLIRTKGKGASGSFKLPVADVKKTEKKKPAKPKSPKKAKVVKPKKPKVEKAAKTASPKKPKATKPKAAKPKVAAPKKSPTKPKKPAAAKTPVVKKPKSPKPKKAAPKKTAAKKPAAKK